MTGMGTKCSLASIKLDSRKVNGSVYLGTLGSHTKGVAQRGC